MTSMYNEPNISVDTSAKQSIARTGNVDVDVA